jgi:hypothetical protein
MRFAGAAMGPWGALWRAVAPAKIFIGFWSASPGATDQAELVAEGT